MHPISRQVSGDRRLAGMTTASGYPTSIKTRPTGAHDADRHNYFRFHARSGPSMRDSMGHFGSGDDANVHFGKGKIRGGTLEEYHTEPTEIANTRPSFGTPTTRPELLHVGKTVSFFDHVTDHGRDMPSTAHAIKHMKGKGFNMKSGKRKVIDLIEDIGENKPLRSGKSRVRQAIDVVESDLRNRKFNEDDWNKVVGHDWRKHFGNHFKGRGLYA